ncbi:mpv17-like protein [Clarias magur]|uniref:Mpv17-like protein n=1 Tax=Clarias magur TaxID=1594786 RepID=A0A8J4UHB6_CLAMG|nr:mpv17-like protein [Clarias magur]
MRKVFPWLANVSLYGCLYGGGDLLYQRAMQPQRGAELDWKRTKNVALVTFCFHGNWNYFWLRALERRFPGQSLAMVLSKVALDQSFSLPIVTSVFYTGVSVLEGKEDVFEDWRTKFLNTYKFLNFVFMPLYLRTMFMGCSAFLWSMFLCFSQQSGDGTAGTAVDWLTTTEKQIMSQSTNEQKWRFGPAH